MFSFILTPPTKEKQSLLQAVSEYSDDQRRIIKNFLLQHTKDYWSLIEMQQLESVFSFKTRS